jgi:hypothetical protein
VGENAIKEIEGFPREESHFHTSIPEDKVNIKSVESLKVFRSLTNFMSKFSAEFSQIHGQHQIPPNF